MPSTLPLTIREPSRGRLRLNLAEIWRYRELLGLIVWRDTVVVYKQSVAGIGWAVLRPLLAMAVISLVFGKLARLPSDGVPYPLFAFAALLPWNYFAGALGGASQSLVGATHLITKVYFPRLILPLANTLQGLVEFGVSLLVLIGLMLWYHATLAVSWTLVLLPIFLALAMLTSFAVSLWLSPLMVRYRDVRLLLPFLTQIWMFLTPVAYSSSLVPPRWRWLYALNPMAGVVDGFRWALLGKAPPDWTALALSGGIALAILVAGLYYFRRAERTMVDVI